MIKYPFFSAIFLAQLWNPKEIVHNLLPCHFVSHVKKKDMKMDKSRGAIFKCLEEISKPQAYTEAMCAHLCLSQKQINF